MPNMALYAAVKTFVRYLSFALDMELRGSGIPVNVLCPAVMTTNEDSRAYIRAQGSLGRITTWSAEDVADYTIAQVRKGRHLIVPGIANRMLMRLGTIVPFAVAAEVIRSRWDRAMRRVRAAEHGSEAAGRGIR